MVGKRNSPAAWHDNLRYWHSLARIIWVRWLVPPYGHLRSIALGVVLVLLVNLGKAVALTDRKIARVEAGLLPIAAVRVGVTANIQDRLHAYGVPGLSVAVIEGGRIAWAKGYGVADTKTGRKVTPTTLFQAASLSKPITAMGVLSLVREKRLTLEEDVNENLTNWKLPTGVHITPRMLLNHSSGLNVPGFTGYPVGAPLPNLIDILTGRPPANNPALKFEQTPGETASYSGGGYEVLQQLIVDVSGQSFESYMRSAVLAPLGMKHSAFEQPLSTGRRSTAAMGHYAGGQQILGGFRVMPELAAAGLWSTPSDIARYVLNVQRTNVGLAHQPLDSPLVREMLTPGAGQHGLGPTMSGAGLAIRFGHDGFNEGYESAFVGYVSGSHGAVVMANSSFAFMLIEEVLNSISRAYSWPGFDSTSQRPPDDTIGQQRVLPVSSHTLESSIGDYVLGDEARIHIFSDGNRLFVNWPGAGKAEIFAASDGRFFCPPLTFELGSPWLQFVEDRKGATTSAILGAPHGSAKFTRVQ